MTSVDGTTPPDAATAVVAESLSTLGYAMFAFLQTGPLNQIQSMPEFMDQVRREAEAAAAGDAYKEPAYVGDPEEESFGQSDVGEHLGAVTQRPDPNKMQPQSQPQYQYRPPAASATPPPSSSVQIPVGPPAAGAIAAGLADDEDDEPKELPQPKDPVGTIPEYKGNETLAMLQEISFLDE